MELLAPAGNKEKLYVALNYGADAVYIGGRSFNLRNQSSNFNLEDINEGVAYAHKLGKKVYFTLNAYLHEYDEETLKEYLKEIKSIDIDAFIVADLGVFSILKEYIPDKDVHISTQANVTNSYAINMWKSLGASRIILARELSLDEIKAIKDKTDIEIESFVHGAVCMSYSGRCLLSNYLNDRDANRGDCSQVCRWGFNTYIEETTRPGEYMKIEEGESGSTILSSKDLDMSRYLHLLKNAGIDSIKIEGRMKSVYYVASIIRVYRHLLDVLERVGSDYYEEAIKDPLSIDYINELQSVSRRESDTGFYLKGRHQNPDIKPTLKSYLKGRRLLGMVISIENEYAEIRVYNTINEGTPLIYIGVSFLSINDVDYTLFIKNEEGAFIKVRSLRNVDNGIAYIKPCIHNFSLYDIITVEE